MCAWAAQGQTIVGPVASKLPTALPVKSTSLRLKGPQPPQPRVFKDVTSTSHGCCICIWAGAEGF